VISLVSDDIQPAVAVMCALLAGALLGFLPYNFHPARVFIGTSGVFAVGYALAVLSVLGTAKVALALLVLGVPIIDTFWIIIRRVSAGRSPFSADRGHFHHRLLDLGLSHRQAVLLIYLICSVLAVLSLILPGRGQITIFLLIVLGGGGVLYLLTRRAREALDRASYDETDVAPGEGPPEGA
jgi:UDP-GlcNAc:undecaprenyl-phosphate GlcNAc-1-phosphate transferase